MSIKRVKNPGLSGLVWLSVLGLAGVALLIKFLIVGHDVSLLNPMGVIARDQVTLATFGVLALLAIAVPTLFIFYFFAWKYRESSPKATHNPNVQRGKLFVASIWAIPSVVVIVLASAMLPATFALDPHKNIASNEPPLTIQVVAMRWKWLFIYPKQSIATVNFVQIPTNVPVRFELTADEAPMSSFWIPHLGGQLYAMTGMDNHLNLMATSTGDFPGRSAEINGPGFANMTFVARASSKADFNQWVQETRFAGGALSEKEYQKLLLPGQNTPVASYYPVIPYLYQTVIYKYMGAPVSRAVSQ